MDILKKIKSFKNRFGKEYVRKPHVFIYSYGGVGTRMFYEFVKQYRNVNGQGDVHHGFIEDKYPGDKVVYLYGNPRHAIMSYYRKHQLDKRFVHEHAENLKLSERLPETIEEYVSLDRDAFNLEAHFDRFITAKRDYTIMFVRYENIWDNLESILDFLDLSDHLTEFPKKRQRSAEKAIISAEIEAGLKKTYTSLEEKMQKLPDVFIKDANSAH